MSTAARVQAARPRLRTFVRRIPTAAWVCALVGVLNAAAWSLVFPAFQLPDEQAHYAYTEYLVHHGKPPVAEGEDRFSSDQAAALRDLRFATIPFAPDNGTIWTSAEQARLTRDLARGADRANGNGAGFGVGGEPPLYYALQAIPYSLADGGTLLDRLALMRLLGALLGGLTVLLVFLFLREALPALPWAWAVGALGVAFHPVFGSIAGGVNSDALLYAVSAALFLVLARGFRRGLTPQLALAAGAAMAVGLLTKYNALGLVPGVTIGLLVLAIRHDGGLRPGTLRLPLLALGVAAAGPLLEMALNATVWDRPTVGASTSAFAPSGFDASLGAAASFVWRFYLVPLPGMTHQLGDFPLKDQWLDGFVGAFGWVDTFFRPWVYDVALLPLAALAALAGRALFAERDALRERRAELLVYAVLAAGFLLAVALACYIVFAHYGGVVAQMRYVFPLLPLYGALLALAVRGAGARWAPVVGTAIVVLAIAHDVFSQLLVIARYYA
jgi:4-amino-4-deoxy-L-arabinose transferase-like glycosyltransferase